MIKKDEIKKYIINNGVLKKDNCLGLHYEYKNFILTVNYRLIFENDNNERKEFIENDYDFNDIEEFFNYYKENKPNNLKECFDLLKIKENDFNINGFYNLREELEAMKKVIKFLLEK